MAYVNVLEWGAHQVSEWLQGLDDCILPYAHFFLNNNVTGGGLLNLTVDDLYKLHVEKVGHQEIILEALELLKNLHYNLNTENLQHVCLRLSCKTRSLVNEINAFYGPPPDEFQKKQSVSTQTMSAVADILDALWVLISWLERAPFNVQHHYNLFKAELVKISLELATNAQRDRFAEKPVDVIRDLCERLADLSDTLIRDVQDSLILQPAYLDIATTKRKADEADFGIVFEYSLTGAGAHLVSEVRFGSVARATGRIEKGDEVVQVNYQTVVGWHPKKMFRLMEENPSELILTLKKRPRHHHNHLGIYMKPFRIPARKKNPPNYFNNLPSPRAELLVAPSIAFFKRPALRSEKSAEKSEVGGEVRKSDADGDEDEDEDVEDDDDDDLIIVASSDEEGDGHGDEEDSSLRPPPKPRRGAAAAAPTGAGTPSSSLQSRGSKSPTQSIRSALSRRPRSAPQRRATISGTSSPSHRTYMNVCEIWGPLAAGANPSSCDTSDTSSTLRSKDSGLSTMASMQQDIMSANEEAELRYSLERRRQNRPMTVAEFNVAQRKKAAAAAAMHAYVNLPPKLIGRPEESGGDPPPLPQKDVGYGSADNSPQHRNPMPKPRTHMSPASSSIGGFPGHGEQRPSAASPSTSQQPRPPLPTPSTASAPSSSASSVISEASSSASKAAPRVSSPSPSPTETPSKKRPIPQPRQRQLSSTSSLLQSTSAAGHHPQSQRAPHPHPHLHPSHSQTAVGGGQIGSSKDSSLTKSLRNLLPDLHHHQPVPTPTANFKSYKRVVPPPPPPTQQSRANPEYVNTAAPSLPQRRKQIPPPLPPITSRLDDVRMPSSAPPPRPKQSPAAAKPPPAVLRDKKKPHSEQRGLGPNQESSRDSSSSSSSSSLVSPYHVTEVASPERVWMESLRQGGVPVPVPGSASSSSSSATSHPMRPTHSYQPLQRGAAESSELKFAFDMELLKRTGEATSGEIDDQGYTQLSEMTNSPSGEAQGLTPPIASSSYSAQRRHQQQKNK